MTSQTSIPVHLSTHGAVSRQEAAYAARKIEHILSGTHARVLDARVRLTVETNPAQPRPARIEIGVDVNGTPLRVHVTATELTEAADLAVDRLRRRITHLADRNRSRHRWIGMAGGNEWRHRELPPNPNDQAIVRRKIVVLEAMTPEEAMYEMDLLDHDFYLFTNRDTGAESVVHRGPDDRYEVSETAPELTTAEAKERLTAGGEPFVFYRAPGNTRARILYRRYDGRFGLLTSATP